MRITRIEDELTRSVLFHYSTLLIIGNLGSFKRHLLSLTSHSVRVIRSCKFVLNS